MRGDRGRKLPGYVNLAGAAALLALVAAIAFRAASAAPPAIAEFAPQAQQIRQAPAEQTSLVGHTGSGALTPVPQVSPTPSTQLATGAILRACVGDPPRQIEDPQSPPCVPFWHGDNGGATSSGVTGDTIWLGIPSDCQTSSDPSSTAESSLAYSLLPRFFNQRFEFYGRTVKTWCLQEGDGQLSATGQGADADAMAAHQPAVFASALYRAQGGEYYLPRAACAHHIVSVTFYYLPRATSYMRQCPDYLYEYVMDFNTESANLGQWACARLRDGEAVHAGGSDSEVPPRPMTSLQRKFGIIYQPVYQDETGGWQPLRDELTTCGITVADKDVLVDPVVDSTASGFPENPSQANNAILQMRQDNVTSIFCLCNAWTFGAFTRASDNQNYEPEWLVDSYGELDSAAGLQDIAQGSSSQLEHTFGITFKPRDIPIQEEPYYQAMREVDPAASPKPDAVHVELDQEVYRDLLVLMSAFQMAGPHLTPQTAAAGLARSVFPNPETPLMAGHVGFAGYTYSMTVDGAEFWYGVGAQSPYPGSSGALCYVDDGLRHPFGQWPRGGDPYFKLPCDSVS